MRLHAVAAFYLGVSLCTLVACQRGADPAATLTAPRIAGQPAAPAASSASVAPPESGLQIKRGWVMHAASGFRFDSCAGPAWATQGEGIAELLLPLLGGQSGKRLYAELRGDLVDKKSDAGSPSAALIVQELLYATANVSSDRCNSATHDYQVLILGGAPSWSISVGSHTLIYTPAQGNAQEFALADSTDIEGAVVYRATFDARKLEITLTQQPCVDAATGDYFGFSAQGMIDQQTLHGCALPGE